MIKNCENINKELDSINKLTEIIKNEQNNIDNNLRRTYNFKGRKSSNIAQIIIENLSPTNGLVCDPFVGSNSFGIASVRAGRTFIGSEIDNTTVFFNKCIFEKCNIESLNELFENVREDCKESVMNLYETECCGIKNYINTLYFDPESAADPNRSEYYNPKPHRDIKDGKNISLVSKCPKCGNKYKRFSYFDEKRIKELDKLDTSTFPNHKLIENSRINITASNGCDLYDCNFSNRGKKALILIQNAILKQDKSFERDILEMCLCISLVLARICQYGSGSEYIYQKMRFLAQEKNVWLIFEEKFNIIYKLKSNPNFYQVNSIEKKDSEMYIYNGDYKKMFEEKLGNIDLIITDPPYTDQVPYLERSQLYRDWLNKYYPLEEFDNFLLTRKMLDSEIVITNAPSRSNKAGELQYLTDIDKMFFEFSNNLLPGKKVVLNLKLGNKKYLKILASFIEYARKNGFEFIGKCSLYNNDPTVRKQAAWNNTMSDQLLLFFVRLNKEDEYWYEGTNNLDHYVVECVYNKIKESKPLLSIAYTEAVNESLKALFNKFKIIKNDEVKKKIENIIQSHFSVEENSSVVFTKNKVYLDVEETDDMFMIIYNLVPEIIRKLCVDDNGFTLDDLYLEIIMSLFDGNSRILNKIIGDKNNETKIKKLIDSYCDIKTVKKKKLYVPKKYSGVGKGLKNSIDISMLTGREFEELVMRYYKDIGYYDVIIVGGSGDRGVDICAKKDNSGNTEVTIIQCKRWVNNVGGTPLQRLHSMKTQYGDSVKHAVCITTSDFTPGARKEAISTGVELVNGEEFIKKLNSLYPGKYYHSLL